MVTMFFKHFFSKSLHSDYDLKGKKEMTNLSIGVIFIINIQIAAFYFFFQLKRQEQKKGGLSQF